MTETLAEYTARVARMPLHELKAEARAWGRLLAQLDEIDPSDIIAREAVRDELAGRRC